MTRNCDALRDTAITLAVDVLLRSLINFRYRLADPLGARCERLFVERLAKQLVGLAHRLLDCRAPRLDARQFVHCSVITPVMFRSPTESCAAYDSRCSSLSSATKLAIVAD